MNRRTGRTLGRRLDERRKDEGEVISRVEAVPESAGHEGRHARTEPGLLPLGRDSQVHIVLQPVVGVLVPASEEAVYVLRSLQSPGVDVLQAVPEHLSGLRVESVVSQAREDASTFRERPHAVVLQPSGESEHVQAPHPPEEVVLHELLAQDRLREVNGSQLQERKNPSHSDDGLLHRGSSAPWDLALLPRWRGLGWVRSRRHIEQGGLDPAAVVDVFERGTREQRREEEDIARVVEDPRELGDGGVLLRVGELTLRQTAVVHVPAEGGELHDQHHLRTGHVHDRGIVEDLPLDLVHGQMSHQEQERNPGHQRAVHVVRDQVRPRRAEEQGAQAIPQVEEPHEVERGDCNDEDIFLPRVGVGDSLEDAGKRVGEEERRNELYCVRRSPSAAIGQAV